MVQDPATRMVAGKRCGTCIDRKIRCDRDSPTCSNCSRTNRVCQGYAVRLSWPRDRDRKRFIVGPMPPRAQRELGHRNKNAYAVHVTAWDIEVYRYLSDRRMVRKSETALPPYPGLPVMPSTMTTSEIQLLQVFESRISASLTTFSEEPVGSLILRIALSGTSPSTVAVQKAILALSYLSMYGSGLQAQQLKLSALRALITSAGMGISSENAVQHVAAGMTLCLFEISHYSESSRQWMWYVTGVKDVIANAPVGSFSEENGTSCLADWAYYHEVLARFSLNHWRPGLHEARRHTYDERAFCLGVDKVDKPTSTCSTFRKRNRGLELLSDIFKVVLPLSDPMSQTRVYKENIKAFERRVQLSDGASLSRHPPELWTDGNGTVAAELHQIAMLIYLARASDGRTRSLEKLTHLVDRGMAILTELSYFNRPFPILMIGFEARDDMERLAVLELIANTRKHPFSGRRLECVKAFLQGVWNQADLHAEDGVEFDYMETLTAVMSTSEVIPPFV